MVIAIVALVVLGPERLPKAARFAGLWVRRARNQWDSVKQELERELHAEELKREMQSLRQSMNDTGSDLRASAEAARRQMQELDAQGRELEDRIRGPVAYETAATTAVDSGAPGVEPSPPPVTPAAGSDPAGSTTPHNESRS